MAIVWVMEDPGQGLAELTRALIGNFAVRCIASERSLKLLVRMDMGTPPSLIAINMAHFERRSPDIISNVNYLFPDTIVVGVNKGPQLLTQIASRSYFFQEHDFSRLVRFVRDVVFSDHRKESELLIYRDIQLNLSDFTYRIQPNDQYDSLSGLEFKLMRLFLQNPNKCFNRDELIERIWDKMKVASRTVDSQISRLRRRLHESECQIESVYGGGYRLI